MRLDPLCALLAACQAPVARDPIAAPAPAALEVESCATLGEVRGGRRCRIYDTRARAFGPADPFTARVYLYERWLDLYNTVERQVVVRNLREPMAPGDVESRWADERYLDYYDDVGDSAGFGEPAQISAIFRYAVTGTEADYLRMESYVRGALRQWEATGIDGYLSRFHYAGVPPGTQIRNGRSMAVRDDSDTNAFDIPGSALAAMPDYYRTGIEGVPVRPSWRGHVSIDAYAGPMHAWPLAFHLLRDPALKARMAFHYGCFLKRLRIFKIVNLSRNAQLQSEIARLLARGVLHLDAADPDLSRADEVWGFYLPQYNRASATAYPRQCPAGLSFDAAPEDVVDVLHVGWEGRLLMLLSRMAEDADQPDSMDFAYLPSLRAGDATMLLGYALSAYRLTGDRSFLRWRDEVLIAKANAQEVTRTIGAFMPPKACRSYYRTPNVYTAHFVRLLTEGDPSFALDVWRRKFAGKEMAGLSDPLFAIMFAGTTGEPTDAPARLAGFGGAPGHLDDPRRNYAHDASSLPGVRAAPAPAADIELCEAPLTVLGVQIPAGGTLDRSLLFAEEALPLMDRPPDNWQWEKDPFRAVRRPWDAGRQQYAGLDLTEPYWLARYFRLLPDAHAVLAWGADEP